MWCVTVYFITLYAYLQFLLFVVTWHSQFVGNFLILKHCKLCVFVLDEMITLLHSVLREFDM